MEKGEKQGLQPLTFLRFFSDGNDLFSQKEIDYCILETGLGGRLDATVLSDPVLSINYFHQIMTIWRFSAIRLKRLQQKKQEL